MDDQLKTTDQLTAELRQLRERVAELETVQAGQQQAEAQREAALAALRESETRLRHIADNMLDVVGLTDLHGVYQYISPSVKTIAGYEPSDIVGQMMFEHIHPDDLFRMIRVSMRTLREGTTGRMELRYQHADGHYLTLEAVGTPARDNAGRIVGAVMSARDITERKRTEEALRESEMLYQSLVEVSPLSICRKDLAGRFTFANRRFLEISNCTLDDILGRDDYDLHPSHMAEKYRRDDQAVIDSGQAWEFIEERAVLGGETLIIQSNKTPVYDATGNITGIQISFWDITARQRAEQAERDQRELADSLREVALLLNSTLDYSAVIEQMLLNIGRVVPHTAANVMLIDEAAGRANVIRARGHEKISADLARQVLNFSLPLSLTNLRSMIETRQPIIISDTSSSPAWVVSPETAWTRSYLGAPIVLRDRLLGFFNLDSDQPNFFTPEHAQRLMAFAAQAAVAIENARLFEAERDARQLAEALRDTAATLSHSLNPDDVLNEVLNMVERVVPSDGAKLLLVNGDLAEVARVRGRHDLAAIGTERYHIDSTDHLRSMRDSLEPCIIDHAHGKADWQAGPGDEWVASYAGAPICIHTELLGFLGLSSAQPGFFSARHASQLKVFADQIALAIHNAQLHASIRRHAEELEDRVQQRTRELTVANEQLTELDRLKDQFISRISHELRTPLTNIKIYLELLDTGKPEKRASYMATLTSQTRRLQELIEDLLEVSQLDLANQAYAARPINLNHVAGDLLGDRTAQAQRSGLSLVTDLQAGLPAALGDSSLVFQAATRLILNALAYTPSGGCVTLITREQPRADGNWVTLTIQDTGPGISAKDLPHIFERFYRGEAASDYTVPGTGLGLPIGQSIISKLGGRITVDSTPGSGAAFTIWLPAAQ